VRDSEAYQVSTAITCNKFPFTAVVAHTPSVGSTAMSVIARVTGPMDAGTYIAKIRNEIITHEEQLSAVRAARSAQNFERRMREEQDSAYERSLAQDRERARVKKEAEAKAAAEEKRKIEEMQAAHTLQAKKTDWRIWRAGQMDPEPGPEDKDVVKIALKMPHAARIIRRFKANDSIEELYAFVDCFDYIRDRPSVEAHDWGHVQKPEGYEHKFDFRLVQTLPRVVYGVEEGGTIGEKVGRSGNLIVEPIKDDDEDEEGEGSGERN
jgi:FAS-associated factor 2